MGASVAAIIIRKEKDLVGHFQDRGATSAAKAKNRAELGVDGGMIWNRLVERAVIREGEKDKFYLDVPSWEALRATRHRLMLVMFLLVLLGGFGFYLSRQG